MTETIAFDAMEDGVQCSDNESPNAVNKQSKVDFETPQRTQVKHTNKNAELRRSVQDMEWTLSQDMNLVSGLQKRTKQQNDTHPPNIEMTETTVFDTMKNGEEAPNVTRPPNTEMTETVVFQTKKDGTKQQNDTHPPNIEMTETTGFETMKNGEEAQNVTRPPNTEMTETVVFQTKTDGNDEQNATHLPNIYMTETTGFENRADGVESSMSDIECQTTVKNKTQDDCEKLQKTHVKLKNKNKKLRRSVYDMNRTVTQEKNLVSDLQKREQCLVLERESTLAVNKQLQSDIEKLQNMYSNIQWENEQLEKSLNDMDRTLSKEKEISSDLQRRTDSLVLELESTLAVNKQLHSDIEKLQNMYSNSQWNNRQLEKSLNDMDRSLSQEKKTVSDLQNRLSKLAGDILTHENTNITDLSDPNRPMKLSETYSEIYDNEWTDAFEELTGRGLTDILAIGKLRDMLLFSFRQCRDVTWERYQSLKSTMSTVDIVQVFPSMRDFTEPEEKTETTSNESELTSHNETYNSIAINSEAQNKEETYLDKCAINASRETEILYQRNKEGERTSQSNKEHLTCTTTLTVEQEKEIKQIWRTTTNALMDEAVRNLHMVLLTKFDISIEDWPNTSKFLARCIDLCWKMGVQEKPMYLDACDEQCDGSEKIFNHEKYRAYMKTGKRVAFVVWPALFLHEGGAMVVKGIAQGC